LETKKGFEDEEDEFFLEKEYKEAEEVGLLDEITVEFLEDYLEIKREDFGGV
jgi:hypothetical protein